MARCMPTGLPVHPPVAKPSAPLCRAQIMRSVVRCSYTDVGSVGSAQSTYGTGPTSQSVTCSSGQTISQAYGIYGSYFTASLVGTERYNGSSSGEAGLLISDASASTTFDAHKDVSTAPWGGIAFVLSA